MADLTPDYSKRDCSLPAGCKDLIDVLNLQEQHERQVALLGQRAESSKSLMRATVIEVRSPMTVGELAVVLGQKPFKIVADLMKLGLFVTLSQTLNFDTVSKVIAMNGALAKRVS